MKVIKDATGTFAGLDASAVATHLKVTYASDSAAIDLSLAAAASYVEKIAWTRLSTRTITFITNQFGDYEFDLEVSGVLSSPTCTYFDADNASQTLTITSSWLETTGEHSSIFHLVASTYPTVYDREDAISVSFVLTPVNTTPSPEIKEAIYLLAAHYYDCRTNDKEPVMTVVDKIVASVRHKEF